MIKDNRSRSSRNITVQWRAIGLYLFVFPILLGGCSRTIHPEDSWPWETLFVDAESARLSKDYSPADRLYSQARQLTDTPYSDLHLATTTARIGLVSFRQGKLVEAETVLNKSIDIFDKLLASRPDNNDLTKKEFIRALTARAELASTKKDGANAERLYKRALDLCQTIAQASSEGDLLLADDRLKCLAGLAEIEEQAGQVKAAMGHYKLALAEKLIPDSTQLALTSGYSRLLTRQGKNEESKKVADLEQNAALKHALENRWEEDFAAGLAAMQHGNQPAADKVLLQALDRAKEMGQCNPFILRTYERLIVSAIGERQYAKAESWAASAKPCIDQQEGDDRKYADNLLKVIAGLYHAEQKYTEQEQTLLAQLQLRKDLRGPDSPHFAEVLYDLGRLKFEQHDYPSAIARLTEALAILEKVGDDKAGTDRTVRLLDQCYRTDNKAPLADKLHQKHPESFRSN